MAALPTPAASRRFSNRFVNGRPALALSALPGQRDRLAKTFWYAARGHSWRT